MKRRTLAIIFLVMVGAGSVLAIVLRAGFLPVAIVGSRVLTVRAHETQFGAAAREYERQVKAAPAGTSVDRTAALRELKRATLDKLVEDALVESKLREKLGEALEDRVAEKLATVAGEMGRAEFPVALKTLYGLTVDQFRRIVLVPEAERGVLLDTFAGAIGDADAWVAEARRTGRVIILSKKFYWNGNSVAYRE